MSQHERTAIEEELSPPFSITSPLVQSVPFVVCSPHSGRNYPRHFLTQSRLDPLTLRKSEDCFVDELFGHVAALGAPLISAHFPRAYLDVNREPFELDPLLFDGDLPDFANTQTARVAGGLGTIARVVADGEEIYGRPIELTEALQRIEQLYRPFHEALAGLVETTRTRFGYAILLDCHSMPSAAMATNAGSRPDFVIGDRFGAACDTRLTRLVKETLTGQGFDVHINRPYAGGYITEHYGKPVRSVHALQLEINRGLYVNEATLTRSRGYDHLASQIRAFTARLFHEVPMLVEHRLAAE